MKYLVGLIFCLFLGITGISLGVGAAYPPLNRIAQPMLCPGGELTARQDVSNPLPGTTYIQASWTCAEASGEVVPVSTAKVVTYAGSLYGALLFALLVAFAGLRRLTRGSGQPPDARPPATG